MLSDAPAEREVLTDQMRCLRYRLRKDGYEWEDAYTVEENPKGTGFHIHALQLGDYVPQAHLQDRWGGRIVHIQALNYNVGMAAEYIVKESVGQIRAAGYLLKAPVGRDRPVRFSKGYFRGSTLGAVRDDIARVMYGIVKDPEADWRRVPRDWVTSDLKEAKEH